RSPHSGLVRRGLAVVLTLCACARDGAGDALFEPSTDESAGTPLADAGIVAEKDAAPPPADAAPDTAAEVITDAGPRAAGDPCASDAECVDTTCAPGPYGGHTGTLWMHPFGPFAPITRGLACQSYRTNSCCAV